MASSSFVHLQCQSEYSVKNSLIRVSKLIESVQQAGMDSVALTDHMSLFSAVKFYQKAIDSGVKPIIGAKVVVAFSSGQYDVTMLCPVSYTHLTLPTNREV